MTNDQKLHWTFLAMALLFGAYLRFANLGVPSFWVDELDFVEAAKSQASVGEPLLPSGYAYPRAPLLTYCLVFSFKYLGISEFSSRLPSAIFGFLMIPLIYFVGKRWFDEQTGLFAAILISFTPFEVGWSRACRMYALFQLFFFAGMYFFYRGFEYNYNSDSNESDNSDSSGTNPDEPKQTIIKSSRKDAKTQRLVQGFSLRFIAALHEFGFFISCQKFAVPYYSNIKQLLKSCNIHLPSLLLAGILFVAGYTTHQNTGLFVLCFWGYLLLMFGNKLFSDGLLRSLQTKYGILVISCLVVALLAGFLPQVRAFFNYAIGYQPHWAKVASAQNQWRIFKFIFGSTHFPINVLFGVGTFLIIKNWHKPGVFTLVTMFIPILLFSFVFRYRKTDYVYNVYPVLFLVSAYALSRIVSLVSHFLQNTLITKSWQELRHVNLRQGTALLICLLWLPLTPGFKFGQRIPRLPDGRFNGAIYHNEWKAATEFLRPRLTPADFLMSTLPLSIQYYLGRAEYNLNWSNSDLAKVNKIVAQNGRVIDLYSGTDIIDDLTVLKDLLHEKTSGWLLVDNYRFSNHVYVPKEVHDYVVSNLPRVFESKGRTVSVFKWDNKRGETAIN